MRQTLQNIIADPNIVRAQTYADIIDILKEGKYQDITIKSHNGMVTQIQNTIKVLV